MVGATAYTTGVGLGIAVRWRRQVADDSEDFYNDPFEDPFGWAMMHRRPTGELSPEILRFGVQFSDGRKATTVGGLPWADRDEAAEEPTGPVLMQGGGGGGDGEWDSDFWLWPLPPPGPLTFAVEWPSAQIELTKHEVDAALILEASALSEKLWPEEALTETGDRGRSRRVSCSGRELFHQANRRGKTTAKTVRAELGVSVGSP